MGSPATSAPVAAGGVRLLDIVFAVGRVSLLLLALWLLAFIRSGVPIYVYLAAVTVSLAGVWATVREAADLKVWALYIMAFVLFAQLRTIADETGIATQFDYPIDADRLLFFGSVPTVWLQEHFYAFAQIGVLEVVTIMVYLTYFVFPHLVVFAVWRLDRKHFPVYAVGIVGTVYLGLVLSLMVPTAPPWLAGQTGDLPHVFRILEDISQEVTPGTYALVYDVAGPNDVAAMPSLHTAIPAVVAMIAWSRARRPLAVAAWLYVIAMGSSLVYLGEHYVVDVLAGVGAAAVVVALVSAWQRRRERQADPSPPTSVSRFRS
ncbi:MAG: phosphatase PAP2 family protein [Chloroflexi bacterium]|nr:phosphatase PAP2 family protein [Chloroflexota bacterium]